jgi:signal transduction histidine kinase
MLVKLRRRFIFITMSLVGLVLLIVLAVSVISSYQTAAASIRSALDQAVSRGPDDRQRPWVGGQDSGSLLELLPKILGYAQESTPSGQYPDIRFTPVYVVVLDSSSLAVLGDNSALIVIDSSLANEAIASIVASLPRGGLTQNESLTGLLLDLQLFYRVDVPGNGSITIALADASELLDDTLLMTGVSALIWLGAMVVLFFISLLLSRIVTRPVAEAWERQRRFVADASHELKTPLTVILANNSLLAAHPNKTMAEQAQWIHSTQAEAQRMDNLVRDLLLLAQTDDEGKHPKAQASSLPVVDLSALLSRSLLQFEAVFFERRVELTTEVAKNVTVHGNEEQLERLIQILLDNASKYAKISPSETSPSESHAQNLHHSSPTDETATIQNVEEARRSPTQTEAETSLTVTNETTRDVETPTRTIATSDETATAPIKATASSERATATPTKATVHVSLRGGQGGSTHALLEVTNTGEPIAPDALPHLFERFFRADAAHSDTEGSGLGLSLAQAIAAAHHGTITAASTAATGTTFTVSL